MARSSSVRPLLGVDQQRDHVGVRRAAPGGRHHGALEPPLRREDAGRVDEDDLRVACASTMPRTSARVVCTLWVTIETFEPTRALSSVDLPAFGAPISATKPARVGDVVRRAAVAHAFPHTPSRRSTLAAASCSASRFEPPLPRAGATLPTADLDLEIRRVVGAGAQRSRYRPARSKPRRCAHSCSSVLASRSGPLIASMRGPQ